MIKIKHKDKFNIPGRGIVFPIDVRDQDQDTLIQLAQHGLSKLREDTWRITYEDHTGEKEEVEQLFLGKIKNYNELKKIMEWIKING